MPNIPNAPGVPRLSSYSTQIAIALFIDAVDVIAALLNPQWGIFLDGFPVITADSTVSFDFRQDFPISDYPVEQGGFQSYDKVQLPSEIRVRMAAGGSLANRQAFLQSIETEINTVDLYDIITPEGVYLNYNFTHRDLHRSAKNGVGLIIVDLWLTEVRVSAKGTFQNTKQPGQAGQQNIGTQQPQENLPAPTVGEFT